MGGKFVLYVDQWGTHYYAHNRAELVREVRDTNGVAGKVSHMYVDRGGKTYRIGYVVGKYWCRAFMPYEAVVEDMYTSSAQEIGE